MILTIIKSYRAPNGCLQYYFENVNTVSSFNWDGSTARSGTDGGLLANMDYKACIRQNKGIHFSNICVYLFEILHSDNINV